MTLREKIVYTAMKLFSVKGYESTSLTDILDAAGTSKGGFYNHFKSKDELFYAVLKEARKIWRECCFHGLDEIEDPIEKLKAFLLNYKDRYLKNSKSFPGGCIFITFSVGLNGKRPDLTSDITEKFNNLKQMIKSFLDKAKETGKIGADTDTAGASEIIFSTMLGSSVLHRADRSEDNLDHTIGTLIDFIDSLVQKADNKAN
ncbi:MAG: TetR/AcrR family transcriptional regulator [Deltaproteobacteria bacterium]|nr:TetR/AcrR family transcriptional regulator [Deltaproteobacteria bacterium]MBW2594369.1 TetR/AcrR family transcriptional regulator [Deltaproteobacteria bacterium]MBW2649862.1 TetR/AcrR family transcriptional regulator [Deltaproteobacteria bacterium]